MASPDQLSNQVQKLAFFDTNLECGKLKMPAAGGGAMAGEDSVLSQMRGRQTEAVHLHVLHLHKVLNQAEKKRT